MLLFWAVLVAGVHRAAPRWDDVTYDGDFAYLPAEMTSVQGERLLEAAFPEALSRSSLVVVLARPEGTLSQTDLALADRLAEQFAPANGHEGAILGILSRRTPVIGKKLLSPPGPHGQAVLVILQLRNEFMAVGNMPLVAGLYRKLDALRAAPDFPQGLQLGVTGSAAIGADMLFAAEESIRNTQWATCLLVIVILLVVYRAPGLVVIPLATIFVSITVATGLVALASDWSQRLGWFDYKIFKTTKIFVVVILYGAVTDYALFLIARYKEELQRGFPAAEALARSLDRVGTALAASALTTVVGLGVMAFADFGKFRNSGPTIAVSVVVAMIASLTLAPALLRAVGLAVFWPFGIQPRQTTAAGDRHSADAELDHAAFGGFWDGLARRVLARPGLILVASLALLVPLAYHGGRVEVTYDLLSELQHDRPSVQGTRLLGNYFASGEIGPVTVLAYQEHGQFATGTDRWRKIGQLAEDLQRLEYRDGRGHLVRPIVSVRSLAEPLGDRKARFGLFGALKKGVIRGHHLTKDMYLAQAPPYVDKVTRFDLVFLYDPFSVESIRLLDHVEDYLYQLARDPKSPWYQAKFYFRGTTAGIRDLRAVTASDQLLIQKLVPLGVLAVLVMLLGRPLVCLYLIASVLLGYFVTIGSSVLLFSWLYGSTFHGLDWKVPMFLFVLLIAVGADYNIYLVTRILEEQQRRGLRQGLRVALVQTGGIITSCGVIMAGTFIAMVAGTLRAMHELGFALAMGVLLDTFVIRTILVPAFFALADRYGPQATTDPPSRATRGNSPNGATEAWDVASAEALSPDAPAPRYGQR